MPETVSAMEPYRPFWGKARPGGPSDPPYHPLAYHSLDVAAVGASLLARDGSLRQRLAELTGLHESTAAGWLAFFLALHDIGKFAEGFQALQRDLFRRLRSRDSRSGYSVHHDSLGYVLWSEYLWPLAWDEDWFGLGAAARPAEERDEWEAVFQGWALACTGHHGRPPTRQEGAVLAVPCALLLPSHRRARRYP
jgi:CRISPR-associated endonuclease/helicase Cas3